MTNSKNTEVKNKDISKKDRDREKRETQQLDKEGDRQGQSKRESDNKERGGDTGIVYDRYISILENARSLKSLW